MSAVLVTASLAPLLAEPSIRAEQISQLVLGEAAEILDEQGDMLRVRSLIDGYTGWFAAGYASRVAMADAEAWLAGAAWCGGATLTTADGTVRSAPGRARLRLIGHDVILPDGESAVISSGVVTSWPETIAANNTVSAAEWAWRHFAGTPYLWGGVTSFGADCSGLVQTTWLARGVNLPRDAHQQAGVGEVVPADERRAGDLVFFRAHDGERISHVGILDAGDLMVHCALGHGGTVREPLDASGLLPRLVAVRRIR